VELSGTVIFRCPTCGYRSQTELVDWLDLPQLLQIQRQPHGWALWIDGHVDHYCEGAGGGGAGDREPRNPVPSISTDELQRHLDG
jgi:hypothetical protein